MDNKHVLGALALSMSVLLFWAAFFETPRTTNNQTIEEKKTDTENILTPSLNESIQTKKITREQSINNSKRVTIENNNIVGSLLLKGGLIDDISFKNHKQNLENNKNIEFLNPANTDDGFYIETGWTSINNKIKVPSKNSVWKLKNNTFLSDNQPIILEWNNGEGIIFKRKIVLDDKFLFKISQQVQNNTGKTIELYPYAQITRNKVPDDIQNFYISHEGFIGVFDEELKEDDYDDIEEKKIVREANEGWLGITDKYWMTALVPSPGKNFKSTFLYRDGFKANYILNTPTIINPSTQSENDVRLFVAAKEVDTIDAWLKIKI